MFVSRAHASALLSNRPKAWIGLLTAASVGLAGPWTAGAADERPPIIDMHLHTHAIPMDPPAGAPGPCRPLPCEGKGHATASPEDTLEKTLEAMKEHNVVRAFVSGLDPEITRKWVAADPERFLPGAFIMEPGDPAPEALRQAHAAGNLAGIGEIGAQLRGIAPNAPSLRPYFALAEELDLPVLIHSAGIGPELPEFRVAAGNPVHLEDVLVEHPKLRIYLENTGYPYLDEMVAMMSQYPQIYGDLSTITWVLPRRTFHDYLEALVRAGLGKRLMFGSDQMRWPEMIGEAIEAIETAKFLTRAQKRDIFYHNAARFLGLGADAES